MRAQCVFEDAATRCASGRLLLNLSWEEKNTEKRMRSKMIEMSGDTPKDRGRESVYDEYASTREDVKCDLYTGPASDLLEKMTCSGYCYWPCCPCVCCVLIGVKEYGFGDSNQYADTPAEVTWRGVDPDGALPQAQEMSRD